MKDYQGIATVEDAINWIECNVNWKKLGHKSPQKALIWWYVNEALVEDIRDMNMRELTSAIVYGDFKKPTIKVVQQWLNDQREDGLATEDIQRSLEDFWLGDRGQHGG